MDSIRPDEDELRADAPIGGAPRKQTGQGTGRERPAAGDGGQQKPPKPSASTFGGGTGALKWVVLLLLVLVTAAGWFGWQMHRQIQNMEAQLEEADYWARQSKLALARFEGELSETGENLQETGSSFDQRLDRLSSQLGEANDEVRKLWVLANEKNRPQIASLTERQQGLSAELNTLDDRVTSLADTLQTNTAAVAALQSQAGDLSSSLEQTQQSQAQMSERLSGVAGELAGMEERLAAIDSQVAARLQRFRQEQSLTLDGLESRIAALEGGDGRLQDLSRQLSATRSRLAEAEQTLRAVDASRAQLTSRLVRLQEQVDQLRAR